VNYNPEIGQKFRIIYGYKEWEDEVVVYETKSYHAPNSHGRGFYFKSLKTGQKGGAFMDNGSSCKYANWHNASWGCWSHDHPVTGSWPVSKLELIE